MGCFGFAMAAIKQSAATAFCLIGIDRLLRKGPPFWRFLLFLLWTAIGILFHPFSAVFLVCPLLLFSPWSPPTYLMIGLCAAAGFSLQTWLSGAINLLSLVGVDYDDANLLSGGANTFRVLVVWAPVLLSFLGAKFWKRSRSRADNLMMNLSILCAELMFIALFGNPIYFGRLANYFLVFQVVCIPLILDHFEPNSRFLLKWATVAGYIGYVLFGNLFDGRTFDNTYSAVKLWEYLGEIF